MVDRKILTPLDMQMNELKHVVIHNWAAPPSVFTPKEGQPYYDTVLKAVYIWNGAVWACTDATKLVGAIPIAALVTNPLTRANHTGTQTASTISDFSATVVAHRLDQLAVPTSDVSINNRKLLNVAPPVAGTDGTNKDYVDALIQGIRTKPTATAATAAALPTSNYANGTAGVGATLTAQAVGALTVDSYLVKANDLVLVKNEVAGFRNGLYVVTNPGSASVAWVLTRAAGMDIASEFTGGLIAVEDEGSTNANTLWLCNVSTAIVVGTTSITFVRLNNPTVITGDQGVQVSANVASLKLQTASGLVTDATGVAIDKTVVARKASGTIGNGVSAAIVFTHSLNTLDVSVTIRDVASGDEVDCHVNHTTTDTVTLNFGTAPAANQYRVTVFG